MLGRACAWYRVLGKILYPSWQLVVSLAVARWITQQALLEIEQSPVQIYHCIAQASLADCHHFILPTLTSHKRSSIRQTAAPRDAEQFPGARLLADC